MLISQNTHKHLLFAMIYAEKFNVALINECRVVGFFAGVLVDFFAGVVVDVFAGISTSWPQFAKCYCN